MLTQRHEEKTAPASRKERERGREGGRERERERERASESEPFGSSFHVFSSPWACPM